MPKSPMVKLGGLWANKTKDGEKYYSGNLGGLKILVFRCNSDHPKAPAYNLFLAEKSDEERNYKRRERDEDDEEPRRSRRSRDDEDDEDEQEGKGKADDEDDDIPF